MKTALSEHRRVISITTVASIVGMSGIVLPILWVVMSPFLVTLVSDAVAGNIEEEVKEQVAPINTAMAVLLATQIAELEDRIARIEYKRDRNMETFTEDDAQELVVLYRRLLSQRDALQALKEQKR